MTAQQPSERVLILLLKLVPAGLIRLSVTVVLVFSGPSSQAQFSLPYIISRPEAGAPSWLRCADLDQDGDLDIVTNASGRLGWYSNDGNSMFTPRPPIVPALQASSTFPILCDVDGDADLDVLANGPGSFGTMSLWTNDGLGNFGSAMPFTQNWPYPSTAVVGDVDQDGDEDVVLIEMNLELHILRNDLNGTSWTDILLSSPNSSDINLCDLTGDGDLDLVFNRNSNDTVFMARGSTGASFDPMVPLFALPDWPLSMECVDFDQDGDNDIVVANAGIGIPNLTTWMNDGTGEMTATDTIPGAPVSVVDLAVLDANMDGLFDVAYTNLTGTAGISLNGTSWSAASLDLPYLGPAQIEAADMDQDGSPDLVHVNRAKDEMNWFQNDGTGSYIHRIISERSAQRPERARAADLNGDGLMEVVIAENVLFGSIVVMTDQGNSDYVVMSKVDSTVNAQPDVRIGDVDMDGDQDLVGCRGWYANDGNGVFGPRVPLPDTTCTRLLLTDMDLDGDLDVIGLGGMYISTNALLMLNDGNGVFTLSWSNSLAFSPSEVTMEIWDGDADGDPDLFLSGLFYPTQNRQIQVAWNQGAGVLSTPVMIGVSNYLCLDMEPLDVDQDGLEDLTVGPMANGLSWLKNLGGGSFQPPQTLVLPPVSCTMFEWADLDQDADLDLVFNRPTVGTVVLAWCANDGSGIFSNPQAIVHSNNELTSFEIVDTDQDGDLDIISNLGVDYTDDVLFSKNLIGSPYIMQGSVFLDLNLNGVRDTLEGPSTFAPILCTPQTSYAFTDPQGNYTIHADSGAYVVTNDVQLPFWGITTDSTSYQVQLTSLNPVRSGLDFGIGPLVDTTLAQLFAVNPNGWRCAVHTPLWLRCKNIGTRALRGIVDLELDTLLSIVSSNSAPDSIVGQHAYWHLDSIGLFSEWSADLQVSAAASNALATARLTFIAQDSLVQAMDTFMVDRSSTILCSYDPNYKAVEPLGVGAFGAVPIAQDLFTYTIGFQNTGNDTAFTIVLHDHLPPQLDPSTLTVLAMSHALTTLTIDADGYTRFRFENILLPDSSTDGPESQGFLTFSIAPIAGLSSGTSIENTVGIVFDMNAPIWTNTTLNTLVDCSLFLPVITETAPYHLESEPGIAYQWYFNGSPIMGADSDAIDAIQDGIYTATVSNIYGCVALSNAVQLLGTSIVSEQAPVLRIMPNPADGSLTIVRPEDGAQGTLMILDAQGRCLIQSSFTGDRMTLDITAVPSGCYSLRLISMGMVPIVGRFVVVH